VHSEWAVNCLKGGPTEQRARVTTSADESSPIGRSYRAASEGEREEEESAGAGWRRKAGSAC
jgi:hypothetical protein